MKVSGQGCIVTISLRCRVKDVSFHPVRISLVNGVHRVKVPLGTGVGDSSISTVSSYQTLINLSCSVLFEHQSFCDIFGFCRPVDDLVSFSSVSLLVIRLLR